MEKAVLVEVDEPLSLFLESRRKAISVGLIVFEFGIDEVVNLEHIIKNVQKGGFMDASSSGCLHSTIEHEIN